MNEKSESGQCARYPIAMPIWRVFCQTGMTRRYGQSSATPRVTALARDRLERNYTRPRGMVGNGVPPPYRLTILAGGTNGIYKCNCGLRVEETDCNTPWQWAVIDPSGDICAQGTVLSLRKLNIESLCNPGKLGRRKPVTPCLWLPSNFNTTIFPIVRGFV